MYKVHALCDSRCDVRYTVHTLTGAGQQIIDNFFVEMFDQLMAHKVTALTSQQLFLSKD